ncbi:MAG TPA: glycosyltransferase family 4 protein [Aliidongia sp.]|nr:glycosyltransferase family 4 protein [Aliidongia sp.]
MLTDGASRPISLLTVTTLFPNPVQRTHGIFVETRLRKLMATGMVTPHVVAPVPWLPPIIGYPGFGPLNTVPDSLVRDGLPIEHPRYVILPKIGMNVTPFTLYRAMRGRLRRLLAAGHRVDLIDAHYFYPDGVAASWLAREFNLPYVVTARGTDLTLIPRYRWPRHLIRQAAERADGLITVCAALAEPLIELGIASERITVLRNGVDLERFRPYEREAARAKHGLTRRTLASVGHLIERKGHHHIIAALSDLPDTDLVIAGAGPELGRLQQLAAERGVADRVRFLGNLDQTELPELYSAADALILASSREGWANVLLEAMACGTPVVASSVWGTPEVVAAPAAGRLMPELSPEGVRAGVVALFADLPDRQATRLYAEGFDWRPTTEGQLALFRAILERRRP